MIEKIELDKISKKKLGLIISIIVALSVLIGVIVGSVGVGKVVSFLFTPPWVIAAGTTVAEGINEFSGKVYTYSIYSLESLNSLFRMFIYYILCPTVALALWRNFSLHGIQFSKIKVISKFSVFAIATLITGIIITLTLVAAFISNSTFNEVKKAQFEENLKDQLVDVLFDVANESMEIACLPREMGGGEGEFLTYNEVDQKFEKMDFVKIAEEVIQDKRFSFSVEPAGNDSLGIILGKAVDVNELGDEVKVEARAKISSDINITIRAFQ